MIKIIFCGLCILAGIFWGAVGMYGMYDSIKLKDTKGKVLAVCLMFISALIIAGAVKYCSM